MGNSTRIQIQRIAKAAGSSLMNFARVGQPYFAGRWRMQLRCVRRSARRAWHVNQRSWGKSSMSPSLGRAAVDLTNLHLPSRDEIPQKRCTDICQNQNEESRFLHCSMSSRINTQGIFTCAADQILKRQNWGRASSGQRVSRCQIKSRCLDREELDSMARTRAVDR